MIRDKDEEQSETREQAPVEEEKKETIDLSEEDDDDAPEPEDKKGRRQHFRKLKEGFEKKLTERDEKLAALERRLQEALSAPPIQQQQTQQGDPYAAEAQAIWKRQNALMQALSSGDKLPAEAVQGLTEEWRNLETQRRRIEFQQFNREAASQNRTDPQLEMEHRLLMSEFPEIYASNTLRTQAQAIMVELVEKGGKPVSMATAREAMLRVRARSNPRTAVSPEQRAKHESTSTRAGGPNGSSNGWSPSAQQRKLALAYCDTPGRRNLDDTDKYKIWAKEVGKPSGLL